LGRGLKATRENDGFHIVVFAQLPDEELREVIGEDELAERLSRSRNDEWGVVFYPCISNAPFGNQRKLTFRQVTFVDESRDNVRVFYVAARGVKVRR